MRRNATEEYEDDLDIFLNEKEEKMKNRDRKTLTILEFEVESKSAPTSNPTEENGYSNGNIQFNTELSCIVHPVNPGDTLQGLSIKYGTSVQRIKKMNNLYSDNMFYTLKNILIPSTEEKIKDINQIDNNMMQERQKEKNLESKFMEEQSTNIDIAKYYLMHFNYDYEESVEAYKLDVVKKNFLRDSQRTREEKEEQKRESKSLLNESKIFLYDKSIYHNWKNRRNNNNNNNLDDGYDIMIEI